MKLVFTNFEGDHMAVFPVNKDADVEFLLTHITGLPEDPRKTIIQLQDYKDGVGKAL